MFPRAALFACLGAVLLTSCSPGGMLKRVDTARIVDAIKADEVHWNADWQSGDAGKVAAHYAPDAVSMVAGAPPAVGQGAIKAAVETATGQPGFSLSFVSDRVDVSAAGDLAATHGAYKMTHNDPTGATITETGSYVTVYKPGPDGAWKAVWDIATPGPAPATPAPPAAP